MLFHKELGFKCANLNLFIIYPKAPEISRGTQTNSSELLERFPTNLLLSCQSNLHLLSEKFSRVFKMGHDPYGISRLEDIYLALAKIFKKQLLSHVICNILQGFSNHKPSIYKLCTIYKFNLDPMLQNSLRT